TSAANESIPSGKCAPCSSTTPTGRMVSARVLSASRFTSGKVILANSNIVDLLAHGVSATQYSITPTLQHSNSILLPKHLTKLLAPILHLFAARQSHCHDLLV